MSTKEPTAEEIREALDDVSYAIRKSTYSLSPRCEYAFAYVCDMLLSDPDRVRALLELTHVDLECGMPDDGEAPVAAERIQRAINLHPDAKGGAK